MRIAIAGPGELAQHIIPALLSANHTVVILTRTSKPHLTTLFPAIPQETVTYNDASPITTLLNTHAIDVLISTLSVYDSTNIAIHLTLLAACTASKTCKRFIPSEFGGNIRDFPEQPLFYGPTHDPVRQALRAQKEVEWTLVCNGWFMEYLLPSSNPGRVFKEAGEAFVMDHEKKVFRIYGPGDQIVNFLAASDLGVALARLVDAPKGEWEEFTFLSGEQLSWNALFEKVHEKDGEWKKNKVSLGASVGRILQANEKGDEWEVVIGMFEVYGHSEADSLPEEEVERQRGKFFKGLQWVGIDEMLGRV